MSRPHKLLSRLTGRDPGPESQASRWCCPGARLVSGQYHSGADGRSPIGAIAIVYGWVSRVSDSWANDRA